MQSRGYRPGYCRCVVGDEEPAVKTEKLAEGLAPANI